MSLLSSGDRATLIQVVRTMFPHASFPDGPYERTADAVIEAAEQSPRVMAQLCQGLADLNVLRGAPFVDLAPQTALTVLRGVQDTPFFGSVLAVAVVKLYDDHEVWGLLGYEGASFDQGGYLDRGFDDLDWLPNPSVEFEEGAA